MRNHLPDKVGLRDAVYWCAMTVLSAIFALPFARSFASPVLQVSLVRSLVYMALALCLTFAYCLKSPSSNQTKAVVGALCMMAACAVVYSLVRQELVLLVYPSLFCLPGALFGVALAGRRAAPKTGYAPKPIPLVQ